MMQERRISKPSASGSTETADGLSLLVAHFFWVIDGIECPFEVPEAVEILLANFYFSAVTFSTLGYGDVEPAGGTVQFLASVQSITGAALMALLVAVLARRITR